LNELVVKKEVPTSQTPSIPKSNASPAAMSKGAERCPSLFSGTGKTSATGAAGGKYGLLTNCANVLTLDMSGGWRQAKPAGRRPLDGRVRPHFEPGSLNHLSPKFLRLISASSRRSSERARSSGSTKYATSITTCMVIVSGYVRFIVPLSTNET